MRARGRYEGRAKVIEPVPSKRNPRCHGVSAKRNQMLAALEERTVKVEASASPRRAPALPFLESDGDGGSLEFLDELGRDHTHDARMPALGAEHKRRIVGMVFGKRDRLCPDAFLNTLALAVEIVESRGQPACFVAIRSEQEIECQLRVA